jgi:apolipoprotein N-acyltransferase
MMFLTIASALLFSLPFIFPFYLGFLIIFFWVPLIFVFKKHPSKRGIFLYGFLWGIIVYGLNFFWFFDLLMKKSGVGTKLSLFLYLIFVCYAALTSSVLFFLIRLKFILFPVLFFVYFLFLSSHLFWFLGEGYPFLNPIIPLMSYKIFSVPKIYRMPKLGAVEIGRCGFFYLKPSSAEGCALSKNARFCAQQIYKDLKKLNLESEKKNFRKIFILGPETTFPFALDCRGNFIRLWEKVLPENCSLLFGSLRNKVSAPLRVVKRESTPRRRRGAHKKRAFCIKKQYQTVYWLSKEKSCFYDKTHCVPFVEKLPKFWKKFAWAKKFFLQGRLSIAKGKNVTNKFDFMSKISVRPALCSELFFEHLGVEEGQTHIIAFVNDSWFCSYFREILFLTARLKAFTLGVPMIYVGHP